MNRYSLNTNMRVQLSGDKEAGHFSQQLLQVGNGLLTSTDDGQVKLPFGKAVEDISQLMAKVFPNLDFHYQDQDWLAERAILAPKKVAVDDINAKLLQQLPGEPRSYKSVDTVPDPDQVTLFVALLNEFPDHKFEIFLCIRFHIPKLPTVDRI